jgi:hypothetical protein
VVLPEAPEAPAGAPEAEAAPSSPPDDRPPQPPGRCFCCRKKVNIATSYRCRCEYVFCATHRLAEDHECTYDFRGAGRAALAAANPVVKADKVAKI